MRGLWSADFNRQACDDGKAQNTSNAHAEKILRYSAARQSRNQKVATVKKVKR
jgi:hypothetical protein